MLISTKLTLLYCCRVI